MDQIEIETIWTEYLDKGEIFEMKKIITEIAKIYKIKEKIKVPCVPKK